MEGQTGIPPPIVNFEIHVLNSYVLKIKGTNAHFQTLKKCIWLHVVSVDNYLHNIIEKGPFKPSIHTFINKCCK